jgi:hypothetical protein
VGLRPLGTRPQLGLLYQRRLIPIDEYGAFDEVRISMENQSAWRKPTPPSRFPWQNPKSFKWDRIQTSAVWKRRLTTWAMPRPDVNIVTILMDSYEGKEGQRNWLRFEPIYLTVKLAIYQRFSGFGIAPSALILGYGLDGSGSITRSGKILFFTPQRPNRFWDPLILLYNGCRGFFPQR